MKKEDLTYMPRSVLSLKNVKKNFGKVQAVKGISFEVREGECFGLLGPNGAGKSTTLEMIERIISPSSGKILYFEKPMGDQMTEELGVQFQSTALLPSLTVKETIETFSKLYRNPREVSELIKMCDLGEFLDRKHEKLSGGQRQRLLLAIALSNNPKLLLLDEPTTGLDPQARRNLWDTISRIKKEGTTIILTTHYMDEAEFLCDRLVIVDKGEILAEGEPKKLIRSHLPEVVVEIGKDKNEKIKEIAGENNISESDHFYQISTQKLEDLMAQLVENKLNLYELKVRQPNLEDLFIRLTGKELRD